MMVDEATKPSATESDGALPRYEFSPHLVTLAANRTGEAEAIRTVRTHVIARHLHDGRRGLAVCGAKPGVGTSFMAVNLAVALSQVGVATLLIDADIRKPGLASYIRPERVQEPAADHRAPIERIHAEVLPNLSLLYAADAAAGNDELLGGDTFRRLVERCMRDFDFTVVDTPAESENSDALRVASIVGYALIVARTNVSLIKDVASLATHLREDGAQIVGAVLNEH